MKNVFKRMNKEFSSDYSYKYDVLRNLVFELLHFAMKKGPSPQIDVEESSASKRIATLFLGLLERQFPIDDDHSSITLRSPAEFARQLNVHVNHLNREVKETTDKTTSQIIAQRILREAKILLKYSSWNISEVAFALGFKEATHFNNFFKKNTTLTPTVFRQT